MHKILSTYLFFNLFIFQLEVWTSPAARKLQTTSVARICFSFGQPCSRSCKYGVFREKMQKRGARHPSNSVHACVCVCVLSPQPSLENPSLSLRPRARVPEKAPQPHTAVPQISWLCAQMSDPAQTRLSLHPITWPSPQPRVYTQSRYQPQPAKTAASGGCEGAPGRCLC